MQESEHFFIDCTYITTKEYYQMIANMAYNNLLDIKKNSMCICTDKK